MTTVTVSVDIKVDPDWIDFCTKEVDLFMTSYCGLRNSIGEPVRGGQANGYGISILMDAVRGALPSI